MSESEKDIKIIFKRFWEKWKGIRNERSLFGKIYEIIFIIITIIILGYIIYLNQTHEVGIYLPSTLYLWFILVPLLIIYSVINQKALKKYNEKLEKKRVDFCIHCNRKIDGIINICPYCGKKLDERQYKIIEVPEIERKFKEKKTEKVTLLPEQDEIISYSIKSVLLVIYIPIIVAIIIITIIALYLLDIVAAITRSIGAYIIIVGFSVPAFFYRIITIISKFTISKHEIKLEIEKKTFFQINWVDIKDIEIFSIVSIFARGYFLKINSLQNYKLIGLKFCDFNGSKQKKIIEALFKYSEKLNKPISIKKAFGPIIDKIGMKELYDEIYNFARSQRFILKRNV